MSKEQDIRDAALLLLAAIKSGRDVGLVVGWPMNADGLAMIAVNDTRAGQALEEVKVVEPIVNTTPAQSGFARLGAADTPVPDAVVVEPAEKLKPPRN